MNIIEGNILTDTSGPVVICHQVNCVGVMGGGLALQIRRKWQHVYEAYLAKTDWRPGDCQLVEVSDGDSAFVANLAGQDGIAAKSGDRMTQYHELERALRVARDFANANYLTLCIPYLIGCGLAGGNWSIVAEIIDRVAPDADIYKFTPEF